MEKALVSVVLPIYKTEKYLDRCIESVVSQTYKNLEILLMDDGSPDSCPQICDAWAERDSRIRVIHRENGGLAAVRNHAMEILEGEYFCFIDSDDYVAADMVESCVARMQDTGAQIAVFGLCNVNARGEIIGEVRPKTGEVTYRGDEVREFFLPEVIAPNPKTGVKLFYLSPCTTMYSTNVIRENGWQFVSESKIISEDVYSLVNMYSFIDSVTVVPEIFYYYCENTASVSRSYREDRIEKNRVFYMECLAMCERLGYNDDVMHRIARVYLAFTTAALKQACLALGPVKMGNILKPLLNDELMQKALSDVKNDKLKIKQAILFCAMRWKMYRICALLLRANGR